MGAAAATETHGVSATDIHIVLVSSPGGPVPTPLPHQFSGKLDGATVPKVKIAGKAAAVVGSTATNSPAHTAAPPGTSFQSPPKDKGTVKVGSSTVKLGGKGAARKGDTVETCNDPSDAPMGTITAGASSVKLG